MCSSYHQLGTHERSVLPWFPEQHIHAQQWVLCLFPNCFPSMRTLRSASRPILIGDLRYAAHPACKPILGAFERAPHVAEQPSRRSLPTCRFFEAMRGVKKPRLAQAAHPRGRPSPSGALCTSVATISYPDAQYLVIML